MRGGAIANFKIRPLALGKTLWNFRILGPWLRAKLWQNSKIGSHGVAQNPGRFQNLAKQNPGNIQNLGSQNCGRFRRLKLKSGAGAIVVTRDLAVAGRRAMGSGPLKKHL